MATANSSDPHSNQNFAILWLDSEVNNSEDNLLAQQKLFNTFDDVEIFEDENICQQYIKSKPKQPILLIVSGRLCRSTVPAIDKLKHVSGIYIYCMNKHKHEEWSRDFIKIKGIITELDELMTQIRTDLRTLRPKKDVIVKTVPSSSTSNPQPVTYDNDESDEPPQASASAASANKTKCALDGYEKVPLVPLEKAVAPLTSVVSDVDQMVWIVKQNCQNPEEDLTRDESASIALYTMEWYPKENSFFYILDDVLRSEDHKRLKPWFHYLKLVFTALSKLKTVSHIVYQGTNTDVTKNYPKGIIFTAWDFKICTASIKTLEDDESFGKKGQRTLFTIQCRSGKDISKHAFEQSKDQVLLLPGRQFQVVSILNPGDQLNIIQLEEMNSSFTFE